MRESSGDEGGGLDAMTGAGDGVEVLDVARCWALLRTADVGRVAFCVDGRPEVLPVNVVVDAGSVVFRTAPGTKLDAVREGAPVAVEADGREGADAWSVVLRGVPEVLRRPDDVRATTTLELSPWHAAAKGTFVRLVPEEVTGRRFRVVGPERWDLPSSAAARSGGERQR